MRQVNIYEAKTRLSALVDAAAAGEEIVIARNGQPRARLIAIEPPIADAPLREFGFWAEEGYELPERFDEPDPEMEAMFYGPDADASVRSA